MRTRPRTVAVEGEVKRAKTYDIDEFLKLAPLEEHIYRLRCVEGWSMVIPWVGFPLAKLIKRAEPNSRAKYIEFVTLADQGGRALEIRLQEREIDRAHSLRGKPAKHGLDESGIRRIRGFYSNVNPEIDHPRWSQARERRIGEFFKRKTLVFNGYADQVAHLCSGMDLRRYF